MTDIDYPIRTAIRIRAVLTGSTRAACFCSSKVAIPIFSGRHRAFIETLAELEIELVKFRILGLVLRQRSCLFRNIYVYWGLTVSSRLDLSTFGQPYS